MVKSFSFSHEFMDKSAKTVFLSIANWLENEEARIDKRVDFNQILAVHGKGWILVWERNAKKTMNFRLEETHNGIKVWVEVTPSKVYFDDVPTYETSIVDSWSSLINELWATIEGGELAMEILKPIDEQKNVAKAKEEASKRLIFIGLAVVIIGALIIYGFIQLFGYQDNALGQSIGVMIGLLVAGGAILSLLGIFKYASSRNDFKRIIRKEMGK